MLNYKNCFPFPNLYSLRDTKEQPLKFESVLKSESDSLGNTNEQRLELESVLQCESDPSSWDPSSSDSSSSDAKSKTEACLKSKSAESGSEVVKSEACDDGVLPAKRGRDEACLKSKSAKQGRFEKASLISEDEASDEVGSAKQGNSSDEACLKSKSDDSKRVDIVSLLTTSNRDYLVDYKGNQVKVSSLKGKYIWIILFKLPVSCSSREAEFCWALKSLCAKCPDFQLVVCVEMFMKSDSKRGSQLFESFLSGFDRCLGVPLSDSESYQRISNFISPSFDLLLTPDGVRLGQISRCCLVEYGAHAFPFTDHRLDELYYEFYGLQTERPVYLEKLLNCKLSDSVFSFPCYAHSLCVSDLKDKLVGFYLCCRGNIMDDVIRASQHCQAINRELVIVLAYLPFSDDPQHFIQDTDRALMSKDTNKISSSWWVLPFDDCQSRRLLSVCESHDDQPRDQFIIVGPQGKFMERRAANALTFTPNSFADMYPFASEPLACQETKRLSSLSLESLLFPPDTTIDYFVSIKDGNNHIYLPDLLRKNSSKKRKNKNLLRKNVILFIANCKSSQCFKSMRDWCRFNGGKQDSDTLLVFVPLHSTHRDFTRKLDDSDSKLAWLWDSSLSWLICPCDSARKTSIIKHATLQGLSLPSMTYLKFGKEGRIISTAYPHLSGRKEKESPQLYEELLEEYLCHFFCD